MKEQRQGESEKKVVAVYVSGDRVSSEVITYSLSFMFFFDLQFLLSKHNVTQLNLKQH